MNELDRILGEMADIDRRLESPGALVSGQRDELVSRRRSLQARFEGLQHRDDYLSQVDAWTASTLAPLARPAVAPGAGPDLAVPA